MAKENKNTVENKRQFAFVFDKINYIIMIAGIVLLALGYIFLMGGGSDDPNVFNEAMFNGRRLYLAPILIILGLVAEIVAIMYKGKKESE
jgi:hypothetical protein